MTTTYPRPAKDDRLPIQRVLDEFDELVIYRYPHVVGPLALAGTAFGLAWGAHLLRLPWLLTVLVAVIVLLGLGNAPDLPGHRERTYAVTCWVAGGGWTVAAAWVGPLSGPVLGVAVGEWQPPAMFVAWLLLLAVGWPPWFRHRRVRRAVEVSAEILAWDGDAVGLPGVDLVAAGAKADGDQWEAPLVPKQKGRYTLDALRKAIPRIAARYDVAQHEVTIDKVRGEREGKYVLRIRRNPRPKGGALYQVPDERPSLRRPFRIGDLSSERHKPLMGELWRPDHGGVDGVSAGQKGYGKTNYFRRMAVQTIASHDGLLLVGDMKPGSPDYRAIGSRGAYVYAKTRAEIDLLVRALMVICRVRGEAPRRDRKVLVLLLDETSLYFAPTPLTGDAIQKAAARNADVARLAAFDSLVAICRAFDISMRAATQRGREAKLGGDARSAMLAGEVCGFFSPKPADSALLSGARAFALDMLPRGTKGECLISNGIHEEVTRGSLHYVNDDAEAAVLDRFAARPEDIGDLHADELAALRAEFGDEWDGLRAANRRPMVVIDAEQVDEPDDEPEPEPEPAQPRRLSRDESLQLVFDTLLRLDRPAYARDVAEACGKSEPLVRSRLAELTKEDPPRVLRQGTGRWIKYTAVAPLVSATQALDERAPASG